MASQVHHHPFVRTLARSLTRRCRVGEGDRLLLAVSGGRDSFAMLHAVAGLAPRRRWRLRLAVGHVNHQRRDSAEREAALVADQAKRLDLPFFRRDLAPGARAEERPETASRGAEDTGPDDVPSAAFGTDPANPAAHAGSPTTGTNDEALMRRQRYAALAQMAAAFDAGLIATAHQADDQLETLLMRLIRGSGVRGLGGIRWRRRLHRPRSSPALTTLNPSDASSHSLRNDASQAAAAGPLLIRPMLAVTREQARGFLEAIDAPWYDDPTNAALTRQRARLRHEVLPVLGELQPDAAHKAVALADHCRAMHQLLDHDTRHFRGRSVVERGASGGAVLERAETRRMPRVVLGELLRELLSEAGVPADRLTRRTLGPLLDAVSDHVGGCRRFDLPGGVIGWLSREALHIEPAGAASSSGG